MTIWNNMPFEPFGGFATRTLLTLAQRIDRDTLPSAITFDYQSLPDLLPLMRKHSVDLIWSHRRLPILTTRHMQDHW